MNLPWWIAGVALALALFGALRQAGVEPLAALAGTWLAVSPPLLSAHIALAGYADIFLAAFVTLAALCLYRYSMSRAPGDLVLALVFTAALPLVKGAGTVWVAALLPGFVATLLPARGGRIAAILFGVAAAVVVVLTRTSMPLAGHVLHLDFAPQWTALGQRMLLLDNWHLLWYAAVAAIVAGARTLRASALRPPALIVAGGIAYAFIVFAFPAARGWFGEPASVNRTFLVVAPLTAALVVLIAREWAARIEVARSEVERADAAAAQAPRAEAALAETPGAGA